MCGAVTGWEVLPNKAKCRFFEMVGEDTLESQAIVGIDWTLTAFVPGNGELGYLPFGNNQMPYEKSKEHLNYLTVI